MPVTRHPLLRHPLLRRCAVALLALLVATAAFAQNASFTLYVFNEGAPVRDIEILLDDRLIGLTNVHGMAAIEIDPGIHYLELRLEDSVVVGQQILAVEDEISQWIVDVTGGGSAIYDVESSRPDLVGATAAAAAGDSDRGSGLIEGRLVSADDGRPIQNARIFISGVSADIRSDVEGRFSAEAPAGQRSVSVLHSGFNTLTRDGIEVTEGGTAALELTLVPAGSEMPEFVVIAPYISGSLASVMAERRESEGVTDVLSAEQISRAGDSDAAGALKRITGLTLVGGQYIYVRGLGERYSSVLLNDAIIPSPDPTRRVVPLDLFPTDVIEAVVVQKTASASLPAEFGGGTVQLRTVSFPAELTANLSASLGYRQYTTGKDGLTYDGGDTDWLGVDDGTRDLPASLAAVIGGGQYLRPRSFTNPDGLTQDEIEFLGESVAAASAYDAETRTLPPNLGLSGTFGNSYEFGNGNRWGFLTAFQYDNKWGNVDEIRREFAAVSGGSGLQIRNESEVQRTLHYVDTGLFANVGVEFANDQKIGVNAMLLRQTEDETKISEGIEENQLLRRYLFKWTENELLSYQAVGSHLLPLGEWTLNWQYTDATASRDEPNTRRYRRDDDNEDGVFDVSTRSDSNTQTWSDLEDQLTHGSVDTRFPLQFGNHSVALSGGLGDLQRDRAAGIRTFTFQGRLPVDLLSLQQSELLVPEYIDPSLLQLRESTRPTDTYTATQTLDAKYLNLDFSLFNEELRFSTGLREEANFQRVVTNDLSNPLAPPVVGEIDQTDRLPSASVTWAYSPTAQVRAAYAESLNRPDFREMSPAPYLDPLLDLVTVGNPNLITAQLKNYDLRWEYYFSPSESFSIAGFHKEFENPIEKTFSTGGSGRIITLQNALGAELTGVEVDYSQTLGWVKDYDWLDWLAGFDWGFIGPFDWENYTLSLNYAWIDSTVEIDTTLTTQTNPDRPLQGQSPWVMNVQFGHYSPDSPSEWNLLYNESGARISQAGVLGQPDIYEQPFPQLDFVYKRRFGEDWRLAVKLKNLLNPDVEFTQGQETTRIFKVGREVSLEVQWAF